MVGEGLPMGASMGRETHASELMGCCGAGREVREPMRP